MNKSDILEVCLKITKHKSRIKGCYVFGSHVYGTNNQNSDIDLLLIGNTSKTAEEHNITYNNIKYNVHFLTPSDFEKRITDNQVREVECVLSPQEFIIQKYPIDFNLDVQKYRHNVSHVVSNSWIKCKKKLAQGDYHIGIKSMFHSLRIAVYANHVVRYNQIKFRVDIVKNIWNYLQYKDWTWSEINETFRPIRNKLMTNFRNKTYK